MCVCVCIQYSKVAYSTSNLLLLYKQWKESRELRKKQISWILYFQYFQSKPKLQYQIWVGVNVYIWEEGVNLNILTSVYSSQLMWKMLSPKIITLLLICYRVIITMKLELICHWKEHWWDAVPVMCVDPSIVVTSFNWGIWIVWCSNTMSLILNIL